MKLKFLARFITLFCLFISFSEATEKRSTFLQNEQTNQAPYKTPEEHFSEAQRLAREKNYADARNEINDALKIQPSNVRFLKLRGNILFALKEYDKAVRDFTCIVAQNRCDASAYIDRAIVHHAMGTYLWALCDINKAVKLDPSHQLAKPVLDMILSSIKEIQYIRH